MKFKSLFLSTFLVLFTFVSSLKAQYVTIPDAGMVNWLTMQYPSAMNGNQLDTNNNAIIIEDLLDISFPISNLDGIQYFDNLDILMCMNINLYQIPSLPNSLTEINCSGNHLTSLPNLPNSLQHLDCSNNNLSSLPQLSNSLTHLYCSGNQITIWPQFPNSLQTLDCSSSNLTSLPPLTNTLLSLDCSFNNLTFLPILPDSLEILLCYNNVLNSLPQLPDSLNLIECSFNNLTNLPQLPKNLLYLYCNDNSNLNCLPLLPNTLIDGAIYNTALTCIPNYPANCILSTTLPFCQSNNTNGCITSNSISGTFFNNSTNNCINNANLTTNTTLKLYDDQNNFLQSRSASSDDHYYFSIEPGNYVVRVDSSFSTNGVNLSCPVSGEQNVTAVIDSNYSDRDFGLNCVGIDLGVEAVLPQGIVFPGQPHSLKTIAGDLSNYFGLSCAAGTGGTVEITVTGPVTYIDYPSTALTPVVNGNTFTYTISDFSTINIQESFVLNFLTNTTAQATNLISVTAQITSNVTDLDLTNNTASFSYFVVNSFDPNMKEVNPVNVLPGYDNYFTYTVHFQNMGNAPAFNIKIKDTLDQNLDFETFRVINTSHPYSYNLTGNLLNVYFPNIMLADSASDPEGSKGFVQYQVKPKVNLPLGTTIENTAHIYFDFNPAVVTNTTINEYVQTLGLTAEQSVALNLYPNPSNGALTIQSSQQINSPCSITITDLLGKVVYQSNAVFDEGQLTLQTDLSNGSYLLSVSIQKIQLFKERLIVIK